MEIRAKHPLARPEDLDPPGPDSPRFKEAWAQLRRNPRFRSRLDARLRARAAATLQHARDPAEAARKMSVLIDSELFAAATHRGKLVALTRLEHVFGHVDRSPTSENVLPFPRRADVARYAGLWKQRHLGTMTPAAARFVDAGVRREIAWFRRHFFEPVSEKSTRLWGDVYSQTPGADWYKTFLNIQRAGRRVAACRSAYKMAGVHRGADRVCGSPR